MSIEHYGKLSVDSDAEEILIARNIVKEIINFGVNEKQKLNIIRFLAQELENVDCMTQIIETVKMLNQKTLIIDSVDGE